MRKKGTSTLLTCDLLEQDLRMPLRQGISRFESLLEPFGLSGKVDKEVGKALFEMNHVRNVLVHRRGIADKKLIEACPWLNLKLGDQVVVTHEGFVRYMTAVHTYVTEVINRVAGRFGHGLYVNA